jgi:hypothetical protein
MKNKSLLIFLSLIFFVFPKTFAQYQSIFGQNNSVWKIMFAACDYACAKTYSATNDTVIFAQQTYRRINQGFQNYYVREDSSVGKVWYYDTQLASEILLADMNLALGDSFQIHNVQYPVDSVYYFDGRKHIRLKKYKYACSIDSSNQLTFIEGIGTNTGFYYDQADFDNEFLLCYTKDTTTAQIFEEMNLPYVDTCDFCASGTLNLEISASLTIYPNPFSDKIQIKSKEHLNRIEIYNLNGELVFEKNNIDEYYDLNLSQLKSGLYFFRAMYNNRTISTRKIIKIE